MVALPLATSGVFLTVAAAFVLFAVIVSVLGLRSNRFGASTGQSRLVMGLGVVLMLVVMVTAVATAEKPDKAAEAPLKPVKNAGPPPAPAAPSLGGSSSASAGGGSAAPSGPATNTIKISADPSGQLAFQEKVAQAKPGKDTIAFTNTSPTPHDVVIAKGSQELGKTPVISGKKVTAPVTLKPGRYVFYCSVPGHRQAGMHGVLTVK